MFKKEIISVLILIIIIINLTGCTEEKEEENNTNSILYVDDDGGADYIKIQDAINNIEASGTIYVRNGTYNEVLKINKQVNLVGDYENHPKIYYSSDNMFDLISIVNINANNCTFIGFDINFITLITSLKAIYITSSNNTISFCNITNINQGINLDYNVKYNKILNCTISNTKRGIYINKADNNLISNNSVTFSESNGIYMYGSNGNIFSNNSFFDNDYGVYAQGSDNNSFNNNTFKNNSKGIKICCGSAENVVYNNNFIENYLYNARDDMNNQWDNGVLGNYWQDYVEIYPNAKQIGNIWDTPYELICINDIRCGDVFDRYPLINLIDK